MHRDHNNSYHHQSMVIAQFKYKFCFLIAWITSLNFNTKIVKIALYTSTSSFFSLNQNTKNRNLVSNR